MEYKKIRRTVTLADLIEIVHTWTREGADLVTVNRDAEDNPTSVVLVDHGQQIHATYVVGPVSDEPEPYVSDEERDRLATIDQAYALAEQTSAIQIGTVYDDGKPSCWQVSIPSLGWQPELPYGYAYTPWQLLNAVEDARAICQHVIGQTDTETYHS